VASKDSYNGRNGKFRGSERFENGGPGQAALPQNACETIYVGWEVG
jgi:hypothetical protein